MELRIARAGTANPEKQQSLIALLRLRRNSSFRFGYCAQGATTATNLVIAPKVQQQLPIWLLRPRCNKSVISTYYVEDGTTATNLVIAPKAQQQPIQLSRQEQ